jgi:magnesium chelatase subunit D
MRGDPRLAGAARRYPFSAVVGQDDARLGLLLAAIDPGLGGVLLRGDKGSAKSTLARGLAGLLPGGAPFVELPIGATEDRVLGTIDLRAALTDGTTQFRPGLLSAAHGGVLYVDEVNLLPDHLVDVLLDVAASGINRVERDAVSHEHPSRFVLVGSMNPEEGELRPQLLDRFGLAVQIKAPTDPVDRAEVVRRRLTFDAGGVVGGEEGDIVLRARLAAAMPADLPAAVVDFACHLALSVGAEGLRADLVLCRAAAAFAGWEGRAITTEADVERVAPVVLAHRRRRRPFDPPTLGAEELERALASARRAFAAAQPEPAVAPSADAGPGPTEPPTAAEASVGDGDEADASTGTDATEPAEPIEDADAKASEAGDGAKAAEAPDAGDEGEGDGEREPVTVSAEPAADGASSVDGVPGDADERDGGEPVTAGDAPGDGADPAPDGGPPDAADEPAPGEPAPSATWGDLAGASLDIPPAPVLGAAAPVATAVATVPPSAGTDVRGGRLTSTGTGPRGRVIGDRAAGPGGPSGVAVAATVRAVARRRGGQGPDADGAVIDPDDLREAVRAQPVGRTVVVAVDASGSMGTHQRVEAAAGAVLGLLADAYVRRDRVAMITFRGHAAELVLPPTASVELARARLGDVGTGGVTPLAEGLSAALATAKRAATDGWPPLLVTITDGRATGSAQALERSTAVAKEIRQASIDAIVLDAEDGATRLGLARELATAMGARYIRLEEISAARVEAAVRDVLAPA